MIFKCRSDIEVKEFDFEYLWFEFFGRNKYSKFFLGIMYCLERMLILVEWLECFESFFGYLIVIWDGFIVVVGDINIDLFGLNKFMIR